MTLRQACRAVRQILAPAGKHRPATPVQPEPQLFRPEEAMANDMAFCPAEERGRLHAFFALGGRICWTCRTVTPGRMS